MYTQFPPDYHEKLQNNTDNVQWNTNTEVGDIQKKGYV